MDEVNSQEPRQEAEDMWCPGVVCGTIYPSSMSPSGFTLTIGDGAVSGSVPSAADASSRGAGGGEGSPSGGDGGAASPALVVEVLGMDKAVFEVPSERLQMFPGAGENLRILRSAVDHGIVSCCQLYACLTTWNGIDVQTSFRVS